MQLDSLRSVPNPNQLCDHHRLLLQHIILSNGFVQHGSAYSREITAATLVNRDVRPSLISGRTSISTRLERTGCTCLLLLLRCYPLIVQRDMYFVYYYSQLL